MIGGGLISRRWLVVRPVVLDGGMLDLRLDLVDLMWIRWLGCSGVCWQQMGLPAGQWSW